MRVVLAAAALGALQSLVFVHTGFWWLQLLSIGVVAAFVRSASPGRAGGIGAAFSFGWLAASVWWLFISLHRYGELPAWMAVAAVALLCAGLALAFAFAFALFARWRSGRPGPDALLFAVLWLLAELARGELFTGFPWVASGYAQVDAPLAALAPWVGVYGIGAMAAGLSAWCAFAWPTCGRAKVLAPAVSAGVLVLAAIAGPGSFTRATGSLTVTLLQGNVAQDEKFAAEHLPAALGWALAHLVAAKGQLVVAPETVIPLLPDQLEDVDPQLWPTLKAHFAQPGRAALIGLPLGDYERGYTNSAAGLSIDAVREPLGFYRYDKTHLVPFGEFIPTGFHWFTTLMNIPLGDFARGPLAAPSFAVLGERIAPNICYEDLFGEELAARFAQPTRAPTILVNISNIGWFGETIAVTQHLNVSRMRSLELQRPMLRATNTGATVVIDHQGVVRHALAPHTQGVLDGSVQGREGITPFAWWAARAGLAPPGLLALGLVVALARAGRRGSRP